MAFQRYIQARIRGHMHGSETVNVLNFGTDSAAADNDALVALLAQLAQAIILCAVAQLRGGVTEDWTLDGVDCKQLFPTISDEVFVAATPPDNVGQSSTQNVSFAAVLVSIQTGGGGKSGRGRIFLPPPGDGAITNSVINDPGTIGFYAGFINCLVEKFVGVNRSSAFALGVLSRKHLKATPNDYNGAFRIAQQMIVRTNISCLRSRKLGHGS